MNNRKSPQLPLSAYSHLNLEQILNFPKPSHYSGREVAQPVKVLTTQVRRCAFNAHNPHKKLEVWTYNCNPTFTTGWEGRDWRITRKLWAGGSRVSHGAGAQRETLLTRGKARTNFLKVIL